MRRILLILLCGYLAVLLLAQPSPAKSTKSAVHKGASALLPISSSSQQARDLFEKAMVDYENLHIDRATEGWRAAAKGDPNFALAHAWIAFSSTDPVEVSAERQKAKALAAGVSKGEQLMIHWIAGVQENNFLAGISAMNDMLAMYPKDKRLFFLASNWLMNESEDEQAGKMCQRALALDKNYPAALNNLAYADARQGNFSVAFAAMEHYIKVLPNEPNPHDSYGELLRMAGHYEKALEQYRASLKIDPKFYVSQTGLGDTYALMGEEERARAEYAKAILADPDEANKLLFSIQSAITWVRENKFDEADKAFDAVADQAHGKALDLFEARAHRLMSMYQKSDSDALKHLDAAEAALSHQQEMSQSDREEERSQILRWRAVRAWHDGDQEVAQKALRQLEAMAKDSRSTVIQRSYHAAEGSVLAAQQKFADAINNLQEDPNDPYCLELLSGAYNQTGATQQMHDAESRLRAIHLPTMEQALVVVPGRAKQPMN